MKQFLTYNCIRWHEVTSFWPMFWKIWMQIFVCTLDYSKLTKLFLSVFFCSASCSINTIKVILLGNLYLFQNNQIKQSFKIVLVNWNLFVTYNLDHIIYDHQMVVEDWLILSSICTFQCALQMFQTWLLSETLSCPSVLNNFQISYKYQLIKK